MIPRSVADASRPDASIMAFIRGSYEAVAANPGPMTDSLYRHLFEIAPEVRVLFPPKKGAYGDQMTTELIRAMEALDAVATLEEELRQLGADHAERYGVMHSHYHYLGQALVHAIRELFPGDNGSVLGSAWMSAYEWVAAQMLHGAAEVVPSYLPPPPRSLPGDPPARRRGETTTQDLPVVTDAVTRNAGTGWPASPPARAG